MEFLLPLEALEEEDRFRHYSFDPRIFQLVDLVAA